MPGFFPPFAHKYWGGYAGFLSGWNYWVLYILVGMAELTAVGKYVQYWYPEIPTWATALAFFVLINLINLRSEERRVGKECRSRWWQKHYKKKEKEARASEV